MFLKKKIEYKIIKAERILLETSLTWQFCHRPWYYKKKKNQSTHV